MRRLLFCITLLIAPFSWGQAFRIDSLRLELQKPAPDSIKAGQLFALGELYTQTKQYGYARLYLDSAIKLTKGVRSKRFTRDSYFILSRADSLSGNFKDARVHYRMYAVYRDSLLGEENTRKLMSEQMQFEFERRQAALQADQEKKTAMAESEKSRRNIILGAAGTAFLLVLAFAIFIYRSYLQKQKINIAITAQKSIIETKQKEILDSIHYAKRIQRSLMPSEKYISRVLSKLKF